MNIKSLLLGSAAAFVAVTGARAADAPVTMVEAEPVEYVRVCDVYGTGYFYIPGTETCLKIGGSVRFRIGVADDSDGTRNSFNAFLEDGSFTNAAGVTFPANGVPGANFRAFPGATGLTNVGRQFDIAGNTDVFAGFQTTVRLEFDAREETELGTLRGFIGLETDYGYAAGPNFLPGTGVQLSGLRSGQTSDSSVFVKQGFIQLGGLTMGLLDSLWAGDDGGIGDGLLTDTDFSAGDFRQNRISYTAAFGGFSLTGSVEDDGDGDITPDFIAKLAYTGGFGGAYLMGVYDEDARDSFFGRFGTFNGAVNGLPYNNTFGFYQLGTDEFGFGDDGSDGAFVIKGGVKLQDLLFAGSILKVEGHYAFDPSVYAVVGNAGLNNLGTLTAAGNGGGFYQGGFGTNYNSLPSKFQVGAGYQQTFGKFTAGVSGVYGETFDLNSTFFPVNAITNSAATTFVLNNPARFGISAPLDLDEASYYGVAGNVGFEITKNFTTLLSVDYRDIDLPSGLDDYQLTTGFLQFKRSF